MGMTGLQCEGRARLRRIDRTKQGRLKNLANQEQFLDSSPGVQALVVSLACRTINIKLFDDKPKLVDQVI